jgi:hypothetical protein
MRKSHLCACGKTHRNQTTGLCRDCTSAARKKLNELDRDRQMYRIIGASWPTDGGYLGAQAVRDLVLAGLFEPGDKIIRGTKVFRAGKYKLEAT